MRLQLSCHIAVALVILHLPARGRGEVVHCVSVPSGGTPPARLDMLNRELARALADHADQLPGSPGAAGEAFARDAATARHRTRAASMLATAAGAVERMQYGEALHQLASAEEEALRGLARITDPRLLARIYVQRAIALMPTDRPKARRSMVQSLQLWPSRSISRDRSPPKILRLLDEARREARRTPPPQTGASEASRAARILDARWLLFSQTWSTGERQQLRLRLFDARAGQWQWTESTGWRHPLDRDRIKAQLAGLMRRRFGGGPSPAPRPPLTRRRDSSSRRWMIWTGGALAGTALVSGVVLSVLARNREREVEELAGQDPLVEYAPKASDLIASGKRHRTGAIVSFTLAAVAAAVTTAVALWPSRSEHSRGRRHAGLRPGRMGLAIDLP